jgi:hypothetical protein
MRVVTFNILHGRTVGEGVDPQRLRECVRRLDPDVLALQEVDCEQPRSGHADLTVVAAEAMGAVARRFVAAISGTPGATWLAATGREQQGTAGYGIAPGTSIPRPGRCAVGPACGRWRWRRRFRRPSPAVNSTTS